jgi:ectoine hydroxylase-related dioxygenase (phytanoyl-CoA dioxygenase family)
MTGCRPLRAVTAQEIDAFQRDGYVVLPGVLSPEWLAPLAAACPALISAPETADITAEAVRLALPATPDDLFGARPYAATLAERGHFFVNFNTARQDPLVLEFALRGAVGGIAAALMRSDTARFVDDIMFVKQPHTEEPTEWHDDNGGSIATGAQRCSLWVSLGDVPEDAGPLRLLRGSHRRFAGWRERGLTADGLVAAHPEDVVVCPVQVGDVVAHDLATIHGTGPNRSSTLRRSWALRFAGDGVRFVLPTTRADERAWFGLKDGEALSGPRFPVAWPPAGASAVSEFPPRR